MSWFTFGAKSTAPAAHSDVAQAEGVDAAQPNFSRQQIDALREAQPYAVFSITGQFEETNEAFASLVDIPARELVGESFARLLPQKERDGGEERTLFNRLSRGEAVSGPYRLVTRGGKDLWLQANFVPFSAKTARPDKVMLIGTDITDFMQKARDDADELKVRQDISDLDRKSVV
mgnify:CR=1 FL=1